MVSLVIISSLLLYDVRSSCTLQLKDPVFTEYPNPSKSVFLRTINTGDRIVNPTGWQLMYDLVGSNCDKSQVRCTLKIGSCTGDSRTFDAYSIDEQTGVITMHTD